MKATELLQQQREVKALFEKTDSTTSTASKRKLFEELAADLAAHGSTRSSSRKSSRVFVAKRR